MLGTTAVMRRAGVGLAARLVVFACLAALDAPAARAQPSPEESARQEELYAMREVAVCATMPRLMPPAERSAQVPRQIAQLDRMLAKARDSVLQGKQVEPRVALGFAPPPGLFKDTVGLSRTRNSELYCTGALVADNAVVTAAHCVCDLGLDDHASRPEVTLHTNLAGELGLGGRRPARLYLDPKRTRMLDPDYCKLKAQGRAPAAGTDLAVVFLEPQPPPPAKPEVTFVMEGRPDLTDLNDRVAPARIATTGLLFSLALEKMVVVGYGYNNRYGRGKFKTLGCVDISSRICGYPETQRDFGCAGGREIVLIDPARRQDTCFGDSGGPVYAVVDPGVDKKGNARDLTYYLAAITSRAADKSGACGPGGIYTLITPRIVDWLRKQGARIAYYDYPDQ